MMQKSSARKGFCAEDYWYALAELHTSLAFHTIAYGDDDIKIVERDRLLNSINV